MLPWGFQMNCCTVGASSQDVDNILPQECRPVHKSGLLLCGQQSLVLTLAAAAASWAAVCYGTRMADADTAGRSLCKAFAEPRVLGCTALCLTDSTPIAPGGQGRWPGLIPAP